MDAVRGDTELGPRGECFPMPLLPTVVVGQDDPGHAVVRGESPLREDSSAELDVVVVASEEGEVQHGVCASCAGRDGVDRQPHHPTTGRPGLRKCSQQSIEALRGGSRPVLPEPLAAAGSLMPWAPPSIDARF